MSQIYRKKAIDRLMSPEQLDKMIQITGPMTWLIILGFTIVFLGAAVWACTSTVNVTESAAGIVLLSDADATRPELVCYVGDELRSQIEEGSKIIITRVGSERSDNGVVASVSTYADGQEQIEKEITSSGYIDLIWNGEPLYKVICSIPDGYLEGDLVNVDFIIDSEHPIQFVFKPAA